MLVSELIEKLSTMDKDEEVFIGLGSRGIPDGHDTIHHVTTSVARGLPSGVYIVPTHHLEDVDDYE